MENGISQILRILRRKFKYILGVSVAAAAAVFIFCAFIRPPVYEAGVSFIVYSGSASDAGGSSSGVAASRALSDTYIALIKSGFVLDEISRKTGQTDLEELREMITAGSVNSTEVFKVGVSAGDAHTAFDIADTIGEIVPGSLTALIRLGSAAVVDAPKFPETPQPRNSLRNAALAFIISVLLVWLFFIALNLSGASGAVKSGELEKIYGIKVLGSPGRKTVD